jgi:hypothetical protein
LNLATHIVAYILYNQTLCPAPKQNKRYEASP